MDDKQLLALIEKQVSTADMFGLNARAEMNNDEMIEVCRYALQLRMDNARLEFSLTDLEDTISNLESDLDVERDKAAKANGKLGGLTKRINQLEAK